MKTDNFSLIPINKNYYLTKKEEMKIIDQINELLHSFEKQISLLTLESYSYMFSGRTISELMLKLLLKKEGYNISKEKTSFYQIINFSYQQDIIPKQCRDFLEIIRKNGNFFAHGTEISNELIYSFLKAFNYFIQWFNNNYSQKYQKKLKIENCCRLINSITYDKTDDTLIINNKQKNHEFNTSDVKFNEKIIFKKTLKKEKKIEKSKNNCPNCGHPINSSQKFCTQCGFSLNSNLLFEDKPKSKRNLLKRKKQTNNTNENSINPFEEKKIMQNKPGHNNVNEDKILEELRLQNESLKKILETVLETNKITKNIDEKINIITKRLDEIQSYTEKLIKNAWSEDEIDRIIQVHTTECVKNILENKNDLKQDAQYEQEKIKLIEKFDMNAWNKLSKDSQTFLITSKFMYNKLLESDEIIDYSGICVLVTKALEVEIFRRFFIDFINYLNEKYGEDYSKYPTSLLFQYKEPLRPEKFTMGNIAFVLCKKENKYDSYQQRLNNKEKLMEYCRECVFSNYSTTEIEELLNRYASSIEMIRIKYRNPSAHRNHIKQVTAKDCLDLVVDVQKLLKKMLDSFDY